MTKLLKATAAAAVLAIAAPASAQYTFAQPGQPVQPQYQAQPIEVFNNVARVNLGVGFYNSGWYNCYYYYPYYNCTSGSYTSFIPFLVGAQLDFNLGGMNNISAGFTANIGTVTSTVYVGAVAQSASKSITIWEPTLDYVAKFGPATQDTVGRFRIGGAMYFGPNGGFGGGFRLGGGASFLNSNRLGIGLDVVLEGGSYQGYWIGGLQLVASPEFHF
jgi:hypothetical protein